ncbi:MAG TPA: UDP-3-O-(3-hydroxymyristoyl)glucosamine N-acyltransferase [Limnobacter sp.]|nr:UDP-3-O-(3-hydroxymyristoyl)glucosamine N-acyltransferase [Limnobacter sp.]
MKFIDAKLGDLVAMLGGCLASFNGTLSPEASAKASGLVLKGILPLERAQSFHLAFLANTKFKEQLRSTRAGVVLVREQHFADLCDYLGKEDTSMPAAVAWLVSDPYLYYAKLQQWWVTRSEAEHAPGIHPSAVVDPTAVISASASIGPNAVVGAWTEVGEGSRVGPGVVLGRHVKIGARTRIHPNVTIYDECEVGADCIIHAGAVIGSDGFGFANEKGAWVKIPQVGRVLVGDQVEIGANTTIDRGALDDTLIGFGVKLDNQIQIAHNVQVGEHTAMAGCVGIAGSTVIGARCTVGGAAMIFGHLEIADGTHVSGASVVMGSIRQAGAYTGIYPLQEHKDWEKTAVTLRQLLKLRADVRELKKQ